MIRTVGLTNDNELISDFELSEIPSLPLKWYWVDFDQPTKEEEVFLQTHFNFHPLAIEDCFLRLQRPKIDFYDDYSFLILHSIPHGELTPEELNLFLGENFVVTFHYDDIEELNTAREKILNDERQWQRKPFYATYEIIDKVVDHYFPVIYQIEDKLNEIEEELSPSTVHLSMDYVFEVRSDLLRLRRSVFPMRDLLLRMISSERFGLSEHEKIYFKDIHDNLLRVSEMLTENRELTADIRDSQLSINSNRMNSIMMMLTIISSVFIPLTFIAGVYGMNFDFMPELHWKYSYLVVMIVMLIIGLSMMLWFKHKGWLRMFKS